MEKPCSECSLMDKCFKKGYCLLSAVLQKFAPDVDWAEVNEIELRDDPDLSGIKVPVEFFQGVIKG